MIPDVEAWSLKLLDVNNAPLNLRGLVTDLTSPVFERDFDTDKRAGEMGIIPRPRHINEIEVSFTVRKISKALIKALIEAFGTVNKTVGIQASAIVPNELGTSDAYIFTSRGYLSSVPLGDLSADGIEAEFSLMATQIDITFGSDFSFNYNPANGIYSINGNNIYSNVKAMMGV